VAVGNLVAGSVGRFEQIGGLLDALATCLGVESLAGRITGDGLGLSEPPVRRRWDRSLGGRGEVLGECIDGRARLGRHRGWIVSHARRFCEPPCSCFACCIRSWPVPIHPVYMRAVGRTSYMTDTPTLDRRRLLELTGVGTGVAVAGCMGQLDGGGEADGRQVTVSLQPDQEALRTRQEELREELLAGNISQTEAQQQYQATQQEALADAVDTAEDVFASSDITIEDRIAEQGLLLVAGGDTDILDSLETDVVQLIAAGSLFEQAQAAQQQQQQLQQQQQQQQPPEPNTSTDDGPTPE